MLPRRLPALLALFFGLLGVVCCGATVLGVLAFGSRLSRINDRAFALVDASLASVRERVLGAQRSLLRAKPTAEEIQKVVKNWTRTEAAQKALSRLGVADRAERLALTLQQAGVWLDTSAATIRSLRKILELGGAAGVPVDARLADPVAEKLTDLLSRLRQVTETVETVRQQAALLREEAQEEQLALAIQLVSRVLVTLGEIDRRMGEAADQLLERQKQVEGLRSRVHSRIVLAITLVLLLLVWLGAGQVALCLHGWKNRHRHPCRSDAEDPQTTDGTDA